MTTKPSMETPVGRFAVLRAWWKEAVRYRLWRTGRPLRLARIASLAEFRLAYPTWPGRLGPSHDDTPLPDGGEFGVPGYCWVDRADVEFQMDERYAETYAGGHRLNWRERMVCPVCLLNNRLRAAVHVLETRTRLTPNAKLWLMEQVSPLYSALKPRYPALVGSEFLSPSLTSGSVNAAGIRHEDATRSSFPSSSLDAVLSFDVFEHVPDYRAAFVEACRVLKPGGSLFFTVPFIPTQDPTEVRARIGADGEIEHLMPPQYHGDPVQPDRGVLCFYGFGWDILRDLRAAGFSDAYSLWYQSRDYGYLGEPQMIFVATR